MIVVTAPPEPLSESVTAWVTPTVKKRLSAEALREGKSVSALVRGWIIEKLG